MEAFLFSSIHALLAALALPSVGLPAIFVVALVSATLLPLGSEPAVFAYLQLSPQMFWPAVLTATLGNTLGGGVSYWMGLGAEKAYERWKARHDAGRMAAAPAHAAHPPAAGPAADPGAPPPAGLAGAAPARPGQGRWNRRARAWMTRIGPPALLLSWLPLVGDPLCAAAGWLRLSFWPCVAYMAAGKFARYVCMTYFLLWAARGL